MTAYLESLQTLQPPPKYITAADAANVASGDKNILEQAVSAVEFIPKFAAVSAISGIHQLANIPIDVGNWLNETDTERINTEDYITELNSDLGQFYSEVKTGADVVGFIASSFVPGSAGVKGLQMGQKAATLAMSGKVSRLQGAAMSLLVPRSDMLLKEAIQQVATGASRATLTSKASIKAIGSGFHQNALEALAFESAVGITMFNSPVLENQDIGDFFANVALGAGVFGGLSAGLSAVKLNYGMKAAADELAVESRPWTFIQGVEDATPASDRLAIRFEELNNIPAVPKDLPDTKRNLFEQAAKTKVDTLNNLIRKDLGELAGGDQDIAEALYQQVKRAPLQSQHSDTLGLREVVRAIEDTKLDKEIDKLARKIKQGKHTPEEMERYTKSDIAVRYVRMWGDDAGKTFNDAPKLSNISDSLRKGERISVVTTKEGFPIKVNAGKRSYAFNPRPEWNIFKSDPLEAQSRYIAVSKMPKLKATFKNPVEVNVNDIPMLEKVVREGVPMEAIKFIGADRIPDDLMAFLGDKKMEIAYKFLDSGAYSRDEIAAMVNVKASVLEGITKQSATKYAPEDIYAWQDHAAKYKQKLIQQGEWSEAKGDIEIWNVPQTIKVLYDHGDFRNVDNHVIEGMTVIKEKQRLLKEDAARATAAVVGDNFNSQLQDFTSGEILGQAVPSGAGHGFFTAASSEVGQLASRFEHVGQVVVRMKEEFKKATKEALSPSLYRLASNQEAAIEFSVLNAKLRGIPEHYGLNEAGDALEPLALIRWRQAVEEAKEAGKRLPKPPAVDLPTFPIKHAETRNAIKMHIELNGARTNKHAILKAAQGMEFDRDPSAFYPTPVNPKEFPFFATVTDDTVTSGGHSTMLFARTAEELDGMILRMKEADPKLTIRTKKEAEAYYEARGQWDYEKTISDNYLDTLKHRTGASENYTPPTNANKIVDDLLAWHLQRDVGLVNEAVLTKYASTVDELEKLGEEATRVSSSKVKGSRLEAGVTNPYDGYVKTMLGMRKDHEYPIWEALNKGADKAISTLFNKARDMMAVAKSDEDMAAVNRMMENAGFTGAKYDASMEIFANAKGSSTELSDAVRTANSLLATTMLRWDVLNAVNNSMSSVVLTSTVVKNLIRAIEQGDPMFAGKLTELAKVNVPGTNKFTLSAAKLYGNAIKNFDFDGKKMQWFKDRGFITSVASQYADAVDSLAYRPGEPVKTWKQRMLATRAKMQKAGMFGEKWTGNTLAEEFNRFVAAHMAKEITDLGVAAKVITEKEQLAYINTIVNKTQGNYLAAQRPGLFQGPIGQAIGLFQTYQFNLIQQMLKYAGAGKGKDIATLMALQGTIHGMNGLPAFNAVNTHLIGSAVGNSEHKDIYDTVYGTVGKNAGEWLTYGFGSNFLSVINPSLKLNMYTRGDINPRHMSIIPTSPSETPIYQAASRFFGNLFTTVDNLSEGGDVSETLLRGLEHNALSRPLSGLAVTLRGFDNPEGKSFSTSKQGNIVYSNDLLSLVNLGRMAGGKPLDEAVAIDTMFRIKAYEAKEDKRRDELGAAIKTTMAAGQVPTTEQIEVFSQKFAEMGGTQKEFNKWMGQLYKTANLAQTNKIQDSLSSPFAYKMQLIMGGEPTPDFSGN